MTASKADGSRCAVVVLAIADRTLLKRTEATLKRAGYLIAATSKYHEAEKLLASVTPDLLVTAVQFGAFNGLQLALRSRIEHPETPVIVTHVRPDPILAAEAERHQIDFIDVPPEDSQFLARVELALRQPPGRGSMRRWSRKQVERVVLVTVEDSQARVIDMSYGGVKLAFSARHTIPSHFEIKLPSTDAPVAAHCVWTARREDDQLWCGAELEENATHWRDFVNSVDSIGAGGL